MTNTETHSVLSSALSTEALDELRSIVGNEHVLTSPDELSEFRDPFQPRAWDDVQYSAAAVVQPETVAEVQALVGCATKYGIHLWTNSQGRNNGYGGSAPRVSGSVVLNLRRMNKVLTIDEELGYALVEPGVSFMDLHAALRAGGHKLMLSVPDLGWGSVIGNALDHGVTYMPQGADFMAPCGMEVVTADGTVLRTGMGAQTDNPSWNLYKRGLGPSLDQLFMQSNFGIVTKMGVWLMPQPEVVMPIAVVVEREEDLIPLVDNLRTLRLDGTVRGVPGIFNTLCVAVTMSRRNQWFEGDGSVPDDVIQHIADTVGVGRWMLRLCLYGDEPVVDHQFAKIEAAFGTIPGAKIAGAKTPGAEVDSMPNSSDRVLAGVPNLDWAQMGAWTGGEHGGHMSFSPVVPMRGQEIYDLHVKMRGIVESRGLDYTADVMAINDRSVIFVCGNTMDFDDEEQTRSVYEVSKELVREIGRDGYGEYRAHLDYMDLAMDQFDFGNHAYLRFVEKIKDAVDPAGIFSPGKQGIWPRSLRP
ncbi:FAD-binding oxidoreductase [Rhodococcoides fascians]|uniref:FAD-binding oxidoreductase n=1 Tax=Rhodococcoides fascians TaxID=1828 RepID=UPI00050BFA8C|nr:FAD-binding oxidoreductase [Rhodococcus fascians]